VQTETHEHDAAERLVRREYQTDRELLALCRELAILSAIADADLDAVEAVLVHNSH